MSLAAVTADPRTRRSALVLLVGVLVLGVVLGALLAGALQRQRAGRAAALATPDGIERYLVRTVRPETDDQRAAVRAAAERAAPEVRAVLRTARAGLRGVRDGVRSDLAPALTPDQAARLDQALGAIGSRRGFPNARPRRE